MRVLVTGGAGYIGSHAVADLLARGDEVVVVDNLSTGRAERIPGVRVIDLDLRRIDELERLTAELRDFGADAVIHFAAKKRVDESMVRPAEYALANIGATAVLLAAMRDAGCGALVLSSTAAVYGEVDGVVTEAAATVPISPYGWSKLAAEQLITAASAADGLHAISLRYFNVGGARSSAFAEPGASNLIPQVLDRIAIGARPQIFGDDYPTPDGTCVRDYVHVDDVSAAHLAALDQLIEGSGAGEAVGGHPSHRVYNVGTGRGASVAEVISAIGAAIGTAIEPDVQPRRPGDSATVVADVSRIRDELGFTATKNLRDIVASAVAAAGL